MTAQQETEISQIMTALSAAQHEANMTGWPHVVVDDIDRLLVMKRHQALRDRARILETVNPIE